MPATPDTLIYRDRVSEAFARKVCRIAATLDMDADHLMAGMFFETGGTFSPKVRNPRSSATGLIQFMNATALKLGTTTPKLAAMTAEDQLDYVEAYFRPYAGKLATVEDVYMAILWPRAVGKPSTYVLWKGADGAAYRVNAGLDLNKDGRVTKAEASARVRRIYLDGLYRAGRAGR
ncbi:MAG: lytic transglycosylase [Bacteroidetes bacterium]|nr:lytic transglycosylase [Bacteroidota bacterium]